MSLRENLKIFTIPGTVSLLDLPEKFPFSLKFLCRFSVTCIICSDNHQVQQAFPPTSGCLSSHIRSCVVLAHHAAKGPPPVSSSSPAFITFLAQALGPGSVFHGQPREWLWQPTPVFLPGKSHGWRSLVGYSPWGCKESDTTEWLHFHGQGRAGPASHLQQGLDQGCAPLEELWAGR